MKVVRRRKPRAPKKSTAQQSRGAKRGGRGGKAPGFTRADTKPRSTASVEDESLEPDLGSGKDPTSPTISQEQQLVQSTLLKQGQSQQSGAGKLDHARDDKPQDDKPTEVKQPNPKHSKQQRIHQKETRAEAAHPGPQQGRVMASPAEQKKQLEGYEAYSDPKYHSPLKVTGQDGVARPIYIFRQIPETVEELWAEYKVGTHGQPPIQQLEERYRAKWRSHSNARVWFNRRKAFYDRMNGLLAEGKTEAEALAEMRNIAGGQGAKTLICKLGEQRAGTGQRKMGTGLGQKRPRKSKSIQGGDDKGDAGGKEEVNDASSGTSKPQKRKLAEVEDDDDGAGEANDTGSESDGDDGAERSSPPDLRTKRARFFVPVVDDEADGDWQD
ncbi:High-osmolarity-induced transcription protein 1 [Colletotrichum spinosum]|uniref:High-osmolarity-induced transcription protein 1 n=1 Tax=Colletotrichum spinosum TaxID=1347390 RepID=A0A4R8Q5J5_9PEZI|nr:High-osmolarity-induced transcription protein 1 [Colletotrichum spinosum]